LVQKYVFIFVLSAQIFLLLCSLSIIFHDHSLNKSGN